MAHKRTTVNCWRFFVNYGQGWEHEVTEFTRAEMKENRKAYRESSPYPLQIRHGRETITPELMEELNLNPDLYETAHGPKLRNGRYFTHA